MLCNVMNYFILTKTPMIIETIIAIGLNFGLEIATKMRMIIETITIIATGSNCNFELEIATKMLMCVKAIVATGCNFEL